MDAMIHDLLLFGSAVAAPIILGFVIHLGMHVAGLEDPEPAQRIDRGRKQPTGFPR
jgi:hypothetical protein